MVSKDSNQIRRMFDAVALRYDCVNRLVSMRRDVAWRRAMVAALPEKPDLRVLDLATGTGDVAMALQYPNSPVGHVVGADVSMGMLQLAQRKMAGRACAATTTLVQTDAAALCCRDNAFDALTIAFGVRNFTDLDAGLREMCRVLRPNGRALILEFSLPTSRMIRVPYLLYFRHVLPVIAGLISRQTAAYRYLNRSVEDFPYGSSFCALLKQAGFTDVRAHPLTFGVATLYIAHKPDSPTPA